MSENKTFVIVGSRYADEGVEKFGFTPETVFEVVDGGIGRRQMGT